jgi:hypothetical protein
MTTVSLDSLRSLVDEGKTVREIAAECDLSDTVIYRRLKLAGMKARTPPPRPMRATCPNGHDLKLPNATYGRACRRCHKQAMLTAYHKKRAARIAVGGRQPTGAEILESHRAVTTILLLDDRLARGDYLNAAEAHLLRCTISALQRRVIV